MEIKSDRTDQEFKMRQHLDQVVKRKFNVLHLRVFEDIKVAGATLSGIAPIVRKEAIRFIDQIQTPSPVGMVIMGAIGCGKSSVLSVIHKAYLDQYRQWLVDNFWDAEIDTDVDIWLRKHGGIFRVMSNIHISYFRHNDLIKRLREISDVDGEGAYKYDKWLNDRIVMIDDYLYNYDDKQGWNVSLENQYLDYRHRIRKPTLITTNVTAEQLRNIQGRQRSIDRMGDASWLIAINYPGGSRRT